MLWTEDTLLTRRVLPGETLKQGWAQTWRRNHPTKVSSAPYIERLWLSLLRRHNTQHRNVNASNIINISPADKNKRDKFVKRDRKETKNVRHKSDQKAISPQVIFWHEGNEVAREFTSCRANMHKWIKWESRTKSNLKITIPVNNLRRRLHSWRECKT